MKIGKLKQVLQNVLDECEAFEDEQEITLTSNTYFLKGAKYFLGISGYDGGYLDLDNISENVKEDDEDDNDDPSICEGCGQPHSLCDCEEGGDDD